MDVASGLKKLSTTVYDKFAPEPGKLLLWTGAAGWILSSAAHIFSIVVNDKVEKDQKKFLVWQEVADAAVNIASFMLFTKALTDIGERMVKRGKIITPKIKQFLEEKGLSDKIGTKELNIHKSNYLKETETEFNQAFKDNYYNLFDGVSFVASTTGSIISSNIITPILRNKFAADRQKQSIAEDKMKNEQILPTSPVLPAQNRFGIDDYKSKVMSAPRVMSGSGMRV